jgi:hypothetical protein
LEPEWQAAVKAIRAVKPTTPIVILGGHLHVRDYVNRFGENVFAVASGRYMETVGFLSVSKDLKNVTRRYLDANVPTYNFHLDLPLNNALGKNHPLGREINSMIDNAIIATNASVPLGCAPQDYYLNRYPSTDPRSLFSVLIRDLSDLIRKPEGKPIYTVLNAGSQRGDIFKGVFTIDDANAVSPFKDIFHVFADIPFKVIKKFKATLEANVTIKRKRQTECPYTIGYVTKDDLSSVEAGDDTMHCPVPIAPIGSFNIYSPDLTDNKTEDEELWDLVFYDFIEADIANALNIVMKEFGLPANYPTKGSPYYIDENVSSLTMWRTYAQQKWPCN